MTKAESITGIDLSQWEVNNPIDVDQYYNCDAVIEAYVKGGKDGLKNEQKVIFNQFTENVDRSKKTTVQFLNTIETQGFEAKAAYIKFESFDSFECIIAVQESDFIKDEFLKLYTIASEIQCAVESDIFHLIFSFLPVSEDNYEDSVRHDGFIIRLRKNS